MTTTAIKVWLIKKLGGFTWKEKQQFGELAFKMGGSFADNRGNPAKAKWYRGQLDLSKGPQTILCQVGDSDFNYWEDQQSVEIAVKASFGEDGSYSMTVEDADVKQETN